MIQVRGQNPRRGFATLMAVILLGLVAAALASMAVLVREEVRRTATVQTQSQLRQLLFAGVCDAVARSSTWGNSIAPRRWLIALPKDPAMESASLSSEIKNEADGSATVEVWAALADDRAIETLHFRRFGNDWKLVSIDAGSTAC